MPLPSVRPTSSIRRTRLAVALAGALPLAAFAQDATIRSEGTSTSAATLDAVQVTAQRRVENIQDVPVSITTLDAEKLGVLGSGGTDIRFLSGRVPSLNIESSYGRAFPRFYIRGLGNTDFDLNASQPVSLVYDDVVQENPLLKGFPLFDIERVEVLRGPQGTLFGRNTPAGVVKFDSVRPSQDLDGYAQLAYGSDAMVNFEGAVGGALGGLADGVGALRHLPRTAPRGRVATGLQLRQQLGHEQRRQRGAVAGAGVGVHDDRARGVLGEGRADVEATAGQLVAEHRAVVAVGRGQLLLRLGLTLCRNEVGAGAGLDLVADLLRLGLALLEHLGDVLAGLVERGLDLDDLGVAHLLRPLDLEQQGVDAALARQLPLLFVGHELLGHPLTRGEVLPVLVGQLHVGDVAAHDLHAVAGQLAVEQLLHVLDVAAAQVVGLLGAHLAAALPDRVLHRVAQHEVEVARTDRLDEADRVDDAEAQEELDRLQRHVFVRRRAEHRCGVGDLGRHVDDVGDPRPGVPQVVATRGEAGAGDGTELRQHADGALLDGALVLPGGRVGSGARVTRSVVGRDAVVPEGRHLTDGVLGTGEVAAH